jgi:MFS family permease
MSPLRRAFDDFRDAAREFSRPARLYLLTEFLAWTGHGIMSVLYNLYLVEGGYQESFVGRAVSVTALGLALTALPAGLLAERWGRRRCLILGAALDGVGFVVRASVLAPGPILAASFVAGAGQAMLAIAAAPFITEHSTPRERTHLFSAFFSFALLAGVAGSALGGWLPRVAMALPEGVRPDLLHAYRAVLLIGSAFCFSAALPLLRLRGLVEPPLSHAGEPVPARAARRLFPIALNAALIGAGAGLVIPFMNLYFKTRFRCSSGQIGLFFALAQVFTAIASLLGPAIARRFGKLRTAVASELLSLPFLVTLGAESHLGTAVVAFWLRATLMQASTPLLQTFIMEALPAGLRARATSIMNLVWNVGWAVSATLAGLIIQRFGYAVPFYCTATLYALAATTFYLAFRRTPELPAEPRLSEEAKGQRGEGPLLTE